MFDVENRNEIIKDNEGIARNMVYKNYGVLVNKYPHITDDLLQVARLGILDASKSFNESLGFKFSALATKCMSNRLNKFIKLDLRRYVGRETDISLNYEYEVGSDGGVNSLEDRIGYEEDFSHLHIDTKIIDYIENNKNKNVKFVVNMIIRGYTYEEIAKELNVSKQRIGQIMKKIRSDLIDECGVVNNGIDYNKRVVAYNEEGVNIEFDNAKKLSDVLGIDFSTVRRVLRNNDTNSKNTCKNLENNVMVYIRFK